MTSGLRTDSESEEIQDQKSNKQKSETLQQNTNKETKKSNSDASSKKD